MLKKLGLVAALAAVSTAASAQTSVSVYGTVDIGLVQGKWAPNASGLVVSHDTVTASRLGFTGSEDLGGGLKANFTTEMGFNPDTGTGGSPFWSRGSWAGLSGGFGEIRLGRQRSPNFWVLLNADPSGLGIAAMSAPDVLHSNDGLGSAAGTTGFYDNSIVYRTPKMGAVTGELAYSTGAENLVAATKTAGRMAAGNLMYNGEKLWVGLGHVHYTDTTNTAQGQDTTILGAKYNFGQFLIAGDVVHAKRDITGKPAKSDGLQLQTKIKVGSAGEVDLGWANLKESGDKKGSAFHVGYLHNLSKRTTVYTYLGRISNNANANYNYPARLRSSVAAPNGYDPQAILVGLRHAF